MDGKERPMGSVGPPGGEIAASGLPCGSDHAPTKHVDHPWALRGKARRRRRQRRAQSAERAGRWVGTEEE